jgi:hypothetical protein
MEIFTPQLQQPITNCGKLRYDGGGTACRMNQ